MLVPIERSSWRDVLRCPGCGAPIPVPDRSRPGAALTCASGHPFAVRDGIPELLAPGARDDHARFLDHYRAVRAREGYTRRTPAATARLPEVGPHDPDAGVWRVRAASTRVLLERVVRPLSAHRNRPLRILDLGAGPGWLASRLAMDGHAVLAIDLGADPVDGLGAIRHLPGPVTPVVASFDALPLVDAVGDLVIWNASLHYARDLVRTVEEALRVLAPDGRMGIVDTPTYADPASGRRMVAERNAGWRRMGLEAPPHEAVGYLTRDGVDALAARLGLAVRRHRVDAGWRWRARPLVARVLRRREPASMPVIELGRGVAAVAAPASPRTPR